MSVGWTPRKIIRERKDDWDELLLLVIMMWLVRICYGYGMGMSEEGSRQAVASPWRLTLK